MTMTQALLIIVVASVCLAANAFVPTFTQHSLSSTTKASPLFSYYDESSPSDYDELVAEKGVEFAQNEDDAVIRHELKRELLLLSSISNRGEFASTEQQSLLTDLVSQLEALNPTEQPAMQCEGEWDLALSSTQFFRSSPFFLTIRAAMGEANKAAAENVFDIHDRATTAGRIGRVRQTISDNQLVSEVDLEVGLLPGLPFRVKGKVVTRASFQPIMADTAEIEVGETEIKGSNIPILNQYLENIKLELPVSQIFQQIQGNVPRVTLKTYYLDEDMRITRDQDDNFFVFTRA